MKKLTHTLIGALFLASAAVQTAAGAERKVAHRVEPEETALAQKMQLHGTVKLKAYVNPDGTVRRVEYISGHPLLSEPAIAAVKQWKFEPADQESTEEESFKF